MLLSLALLQNSGEQTQVLILIWNKFCGMNVNGIPIPEKGSQRLFQIWMDGWMTRQNEDILRARIIVSKTMMTEKSS